MLANLHCFFDLLLFRLPAPSLGRPSTATPSTPFDSASRERLRDGEGDAWWALVDPSTDSAVGGLPTSRDSLRARLCNGATVREGRGRSLRRSRRMAGPRCASRMRIRRSRLRDATSGRVPRERVDDGEGGDGGDWSSSLRRTVGLSGASEAKPETEAMSALSSSSSSRVRLREEELLEDAAVDGVGSGLW